MKKYGLVQDEEFTRYLNLIGKSMALYSARQELDFRFAVLDTNEVNAFACPRGSLELMTSEAELTIRIYFFNSNYLKGKIYKTSASLL